METLRCVRPRYRELFLGFIFVTSFLTVKFSPHSSVLTVCLVGGRSELVFDYWGLGSIYFYFIIIFFFLDGVFLYSPGCPASSYVD